MIYVLSQGIVQPAVLTRSNTGLALTFSSKQIWAPTIYKYTAGPFVVKEWRNTLTWTLTLVSIHAAIAPEANSDSTVKILSPGQLTQVLNAAQATAAQNWVNNSDIPNVVITAGMTVKDAIIAILNGLGQSSDAALQLDALEIQLDS
jgi:hypothetical protein